MNKKLAKWVENWYLFKKPMFEVDYSVDLHAPPYKLSFVGGNKIKLKVGRKWLESRAEDDPYLAEILHEVKVEEEL